MSHSLPDNPSEDAPGRDAIDPDAGTDDFAAEHEDTGTAPSGQDTGEPESPEGRSGLEPSRRPN